MKYRITFLDYWHIDSGMSGGAKFDNVVVKDSNGLPYVPAKTIKGLVKEQFEKFDTERLVEFFGMEGTKEGKLYFKNATLPQKLANAIVQKNLQKYLYDVISSTAIEHATGVAVDQSLRDLEVVVPLSLEGEILSIEKDEILCKALFSIKRMGLKRHRGLGRCKIEVIS